MTTITREIWWNVPSWMAWALYVGSALTLGYSAWKGWGHLAAWRRGHPAAGSEPVRVGHGLRDLLVELITHRKLFRDREAAQAHLLIFFGFLLLFLGTCLVFIHDKLVPFLIGPAYLVFSLILDLAGLAFLLGLGMAIHRRFLRPVPRLEQSWDWGVILITLCAIGVTGFLLEGSRIAAAMSTFEIWSPAGYALAWGMRLLSADPFVWRGVHRALWGIHAATVFLFFALLVITPLRHLFAGPATIFLRHARALGALVPAVEPLLVERAQDLTWRQLMDVSTCVRCGRCTAVCPAMAAGKPLDPRAAVQSILASMEDGTPLTTRFSHDAAWSCTTCAACVWECPFDIEVLDKLVAIRRSRVERGGIDRTVAEPLEGIAERGNPWRQPPSRRMEWAQGLEVRVLQPGESVDTLYWVGCAGAFDPLGQSVARAVIQLLRRAGVEFALLGTAERCTGDPARRMGEEGLFAQCASRNVTTLGCYRFRSLLTHCAHCYHIFRNEYPAFGGRYEVVHHSRLLGELIWQGRLRPMREVGEGVTLHDPCYLGRHNGEWEAPRDLLRRLSGLNLVEMPRSRDRSFCCGAGGGGNWVEVRDGQRIASLRMDEAERTGAGTVATACPFCKVMLEGERASRASAPRVRDVAELLLEAQG